MQMLSKREAARVAGMTPSGIRDAIYSGELPATKLQEGRKDWRIDPVDLRVFMERRAARLAEWEELRRNYTCRGKPSYSHYQRGCRCDGCRAEHTRSCAKRRRVRAARRAEADFKHGRAAYSNWECRCGVCKAEWLAYCQKGSERRQEATLPFAVNYGTPWSAEEIAVLLRDDLSLTELALELGRSYNGVSVARSYYRKALQGV